MHVWRERLARWFDAPARRCPLSPNAITIIALALNLAAAAALYGGGHRPELFMAAIVLLAIGGLADAFDGVVARVQGKTTRFGDFLDHVADRIGDTVVVAAWMIGSGVSHTLTVAGVFAVMLNGYVGTQIEATWHERNYESVGRGEFVLALIIFPIVSYTLAVNGWIAVPFGGFTIPEWLTVLLIVFATVGVGQRIALAGRLERGR